MADDDIWTATDHDDDQGRLYALDHCGAECVAGLLIGRQAVHLTSEDLADLVRAAAGLAGLTVVDHPAPAVPTPPADESWERFAVDMRFQALRAAVDMSSRRVDFRMHNVEEAERLDIPGEVLADTVRYHRWLADGEVPA